MRLGWFTGARLYQMWRMWVRGRNSSGGKGMSTPRPTDSAIGFAAFFVLVCGGVFLAVRFVIWMMTKG